MANESMTHSQLTQDYFYGQIMIKKFYIWVNKLQTNKSAVPAPPAGRMTVVDPKASSMKPFTFPAWDLDTCHVVAGARLQIRPVTN